jgi:hypothetical protein
MDVVCFFGALLFAIIIAIGRRYISVTFFFRVNIWRVERNRKSYLFRMYRRQRCVISTSQAIKMGAESESSQRQQSVNDFCELHMFRR